MSTDPAPVQRLVGPFYILCNPHRPFPEQNRMVVVESYGGTVFMATFADYGVINSPYWEISGTNASRRAHPMDKWAYYDRPNPQDQGARPADQGEAL
jgi:hypothetical protein